MKIQIMTTEAIAYVKKNIDELIPHYKNGEQPSKWLKERLGKDPFITVEGLEFEDFELQVSPNKPSADDAFNAKLLYSKMKTLNDSFASDVRLWAGLAHTAFYDYLLKRWPDYFDKSDILNHFFFSQAKPRCYFVNTLARLWWLGRKTYSDDFEDNWKIMDYISHDINGYAFTLFGSNWSNSKRTLSLFMKSIFKYENEAGKAVYRELFNDALKFMNCLGGTYIVDACDDNFVINNVINFIKARAKEREKEAEENKLNNVKTTGIEKFDTVIKAINKIGGIGTLIQIEQAYSDLMSKGLSQAQKDYIKEALDENCIDSSNYKGKPIFYKIIVGGKQAWKIANEYLIKDNRESRNDFLFDQIDGLSDSETLLFNTLNCIRGEKISIEDILAFKQQIITGRPEIANYESFVKENIKALCAKGLLEKTDESVYKKSFHIKIK